MVKFGNPYINIVHVASNKEFVDPFLKLTVSTGAYNVADKYPVVTKTI